MNKHSPFISGAFRVTSAYGDRPSLGDFHRGIDLVGLDEDNIVCAVEPGKVIQSRIITDRSNRTWEWGNYVAIRHSDGTTAYYCHLDSRSAAVGQKVLAGQKIGVMGNTGRSFGAHLHFEIRNILGISFNPAGWLGIPNFDGAVVEIPVDTEPDYIAMIVERCGLEEQTEIYLREYKYAADLGRKLYEQMV